jgi:hypothetical protein
MKKLSYRKCVFLILLILSSCEFNWETHSSSTIGITYTGVIRFTDDGSGIKSISPNGVLIFNVNRNTLEVHGDNQGKISYQVNGSQRSTTLSHKGLVLLKEAFRFCRSDSSLRNPPYILQDTSVKNN